MSALTKPRSTTVLLGEPWPTRVDHPMKAGAVGYKGGIAVLDGGYLAPGSTGTGLVTVGVFDDTVDNTDGADGAVAAPVRPGVHRFANSADADAITQADAGGLCYVVDDQTVAKTSATATRSIAGVIYGVDAGGVWVQMGLRWWG